MIEYKPNTIGYLDITFGPIWDYIPLTRNYVENFLLVNLVDKKKITRIAMAAAELLENAVKYCNKDGIRLKLTKEDSQNEIRVSVYNFANLDEKNDLVSHIDGMNKSEPLEYYLGQMKKSVIRKDGKSCLGLARIHHEANARITATFHEDEKIVQVEAVFEY